MMKHKYINKVKYFNEKKNSTMFRQVYIAGEDVTYTKHSNIKLYKSGNDKCFVGDGFNENVRMK